MRFLLQLSLVFLFSCEGSANLNSDGAINMAPEDSTKIVSEKTVLLNCGKGYRINNYRDSTGAKFIEFEENETFIKKLELPTPSDYNGFSLNWIKETSEGAEISIEYGSRIYYSQVFTFVCRRDSLYLEKILTKNFDKQNPENYDSSITRFDMLIFVEEFFLADYL